MDSVPVWVKALFAAFVGGASAALYDALVMQQGQPTTDYKKAALAAVFGGVLAVAAYLKKSPVQPSEPPASINPQRFQ